VTEELSGGPGDQLSPPELEFGERWRPLIDRVGGDGGQARVAKSLNWTTSTVSRDYKGDTLPTDERLLQLCHALQLPDREKLHLASLLRRARAARQERLRASRGVRELRPERNRRAQWRRTRLPHALGSARFATYGLYAQRSGWNRHLQYGDRADNQWFDLDLCLHSANDVSRSRPVRILCPLREQRPESHHSVTAGPSLPWTDCQPRHPHFRHSQANGTHSPSR